MDAPLWLTVDEYATLYRLPRASVYAAVANGSLEHRRVGRNIRMHRDAGFVPATPQVRRRKPALVIVRRNGATVAVDRRPQQDTKKARAGS
jgi:excisionase family DNA binding protein